MAQVKLGANASQGEAFRSTSEAGTAANVLPLLPLRELIAFPHVIYPVFVGRGLSIKAVHSARERKVPIVLAGQKDARVYNPGGDDVYRIGVLGALIRVESLPDQTLKVLIEGKRRVRISRFVVDEEAFNAEIEEIGEETPAAKGLEKRLELVASSFVASRFKSLASNRSIYLTGNEDASVIADRIASNLPIVIERKQELLETMRSDELRKILAILNAPERERTET